MLRDSRSYEAQIIDAVRSVNKALGGTYGTSSAINKTEFNQYEVQLIDAIKGIGRTLSGKGLSIAGGGVGEVTALQFQELSQRVSKLESESFFRLVNGNVTLKEQYQNLWVPGWLAAGGIGSESGGGGGVSYLRELEDVYHAEGTNVLRSDGTPAVAGDALVYSGEEWGWVAAPQNTTVTGVVKAIACGGSPYNNMTPDANGLVSITTAVTTLFNGWAVNHIDIYRNYNPPQGEGTAIATITIGTAAPVVIKAPTSGGSGGSSTLSGLDDVTISNLSAGQALVYRNNAWRNEAITPGTGLYLGDLENVSLYAPSNGQALVYRNGTWVNETIQGGGGSGGGYIGYTSVQSSAGAQNLYGIPYINATNSATSASRIVWNETLGAWHFYGNVYADGWVSAGGVGSGSGGGGVTSLYALDEVLSTTNPSSNQVFYFNGSKWTATTLKTVGGTSLIGSGNIPVGSGGSTVSWGTVGADHVYLSVDNVSRKLLTAHQSLTNYVTLDTAQTITGTKTFTGGVVVDSSSYIDLGPVRIKFENNALHITKKDSSDTNNYGIYADGFVSAGGVGQSS